MSIFILSPRSYLLTYRPRNCAFVNFTNVSNAIKGIEGIKNQPEYANLRIAHGKDRCANAPRSGPQGASGGRRNTSGTTPTEEPVSAVEGEMEGIEDDGSSSADVEKMEA